MVGSFDLVGVRVGHVRVVDRCGRMCVCACDCGARFERRASTIQRAMRERSDQYCAYSCPARRVYGRGRIQPGTRIGWLTAQYQILDGSGVGRWQCVCDCGRHIIKRTDTLLRALSRGSRSGCGRGCGMRHKSHRIPRQSASPVPCDQPAGMDADMIMRVESSYIRACRRGVTEGT